MTPHEFYSGFTKQLRTVVDQIATEEVEAAQKRIELRVREAVQNYAITFQDALTRRAEGSDLAVTINVNFHGITR